MMADTPGITHTGSRNDHLRPGIKVDGLGFITGDCHLQAWELNGVDAALYQFSGFFIVAPQQVLLKNMSSLHCQRTIHIYLKIAMSCHHMIQLDLTQEE